ncbi:MAG: putative metal-binding motif-containing protein [Alphaproteobacteria bacterium]|nr:putative metal-binding motif-containing protein [Alphaproteobacteria bacterium]
MSPSPPWVRACLSRSRKESPVNRWIPLTLLAALGCGEKDNTPTDDSLGGDDSGVTQDDSGGCDTPTTWYLDGDGDGYGAEPVEACEAPTGAVAEGGDCDDDDPQTSPGSPELCDEVDNDCDGEADEDLLLTFFLDADGDGHGDAASPTEACGPPEGYVSSDNDCDDTDPSVSPSQPEVCGDGVDNDCDALLDCEDGACAVDAFCAELDCEDGLDNEGDGLADCMDEDCWSASCGRLELQVSAARNLEIGVGGGRRAAWRTVLHVEDGVVTTLMDTSNSRVTRHDRRAAQTIRGLARWRLGSGTTTCSWTVDSVAWRAGTSTYMRAGTSFGTGVTSTTVSRYDDGPTRDGFQLSSACPMRLASSELPGVLTVVGAGLATPSGALWYRPSSNFETTVFSSAGAGSFTSTVPYSSSGRSYNFVFGETHSAFFSSYAFSLRVPPGDVVVEPWRP